jgi:hypothetical protein
VSPVYIHFPSHLRLPLGSSLLPTFLSRRNCEFISHSDHANIVDYEENYDNNYQLLGIYLSRLIANVSKRRRLRDGESVFLFYLMTQREFRQGDSTSIYECVKLIPPVTFKGLYRV